MIFAAAGGGDVTTWANNRLGHWERVWDSQYHAGVTLVWWNLCLKSGPTVPVSTQDNALAVYNEIVSRAPGVPIVVSAMNGYEPGFPRYDAYLASVELHDWLVATVAVDPGPVLPLLTSDLLGADDTHPNSAGIDVLGQALVDAFGL